MERKEYGLLTAVTMISGIVIGSGIFFKSDNVLVYTNGNVLLGAVVWVIAAFGIVFGSLSIAQLAARTDKPGGVITYAEESWNKGVACAFGWFHGFVYYPTLVAVVSWAAGIFTCILFGLENTLENQVLIGLVAIVVIYLINTLSARLGGYFQNASMLIKLIPLLTVAVVGFVFGDPAPVLAHDVTTVAQSGGWIAAIVPIAFSFDGWIIATSVGHEIKNSKRNLPIALVITPMLILAIYLFYFIGVTTLVGPQQVMELGDAHASVAANMIFGPMGGKIMLIFVIISVLGTVNGLVLGLIRVPYSLALRGMLPASATVSREHPRLKMPVFSAALGFVVSLLWMAIHYFTQKFALLPNSDVSEISIVVNYTFYILMYIAVIRLARQGEIKGKWSGYVFPTLAIAGSLSILYGGIKNPLFFYYALVCSLVVGSSVLYYWTHRQKIQ